MMLDDPQELFDPSNRRHMADALPLIVKEVGSVIVSCNDLDFEKRLAISATKTIGAELHDRRTIHTLTSRRYCIELGEFAEEIDRRRRAFKANENADGPAVDYAIHLRIYIENRLLDLFPTADPGLSKQPTLSELLNALRGRRRSGRPPYTGRAFGMLLDWPKLVDGNRFLNLMNDAHHSPAKLT